MLIKIFGFNSIFKVSIQTYLLAPLRDLTEVVQDLIERMVCQQLTAFLEKLDLFAKISVRIPRKSLNRDCSSQGSLRYIDGCWHWNGLASRFVGHVSSIWHCRSWYSDLPARDIIRHHGHGSRLASILPDETNTTGCLQWTFIIQGHSRLWRSAGISPGTIAFPPLYGRYPFDCFRAPYWSSLLRRRWATLPVRKGCWGGINDLKGQGMHCWYRHLDVFQQIETQFWQNPVYLAWKQISASKGGHHFHSARYQRSSIPIQCERPWSDYRRPPFNEGSRPENLPVVILPVKTVADGT